MTTRIGQGYIAALSQPAASTGVRLGQAYTVALSSMPATVRIGLSYICALVRLTPLGLKSLAPLGYVPLVCNPCESPLVWSCENGDSRR